LRHLLLIAPLALLAACGSDEVDVENATPSEVARELRDADAEQGFVNPGKWRQTVTMLEMSAPGMPPEAAAAMNQVAKQAQVHEVCLTEAQAKRPREDFFTGADQNCKYEHFKWGGGKLDLKLNCKHPQATQTMVLTGEYEPDSYTMAMTATSSGDAPAAAMTMKMKVDAERIGECTGKEQG
jgi:hypothetical protein